MTRIDLSEVTLRVLFPLVADELARARHEIERQQGMRQHCHDQIQRLVDANTQLIKERDEARAAVPMHATASAYHGELMLIAQDLGVEGIGEIRDAIALRDIQTQRVIETWRPYRAQAHVKDIGAFYALADALDALAQIQPQQREEQVS